MTFDRRTLIKASAAFGLVAGSRFRALAQDTNTGIIHRAIPATGEKIPVVGLGSWITFNVGNDTKLLNECSKVIEAFLDGGGRVIDSSPMYGSSQATIGYGLKKLGHPIHCFAADKVWTSYEDNGPEQIAESRAHWGIAKFSLLQVHNLVAWQGHLKTLRAMKERGDLSYVGMTTSHGRRHDLLETIMRNERPDFIQLTYNILDREADERLLPLAQDLGIAVIINRPYRRGELIRKFEGRPLPDWLPETGAKNWAQFLLKYVISHPAVTCAIPATTRVEHVKENLASARSALPDAALRKKMVAYVEQL